jgi:tRNA U34 2-thiouridine synthase MnmA/TrmU
VHSAYKAGSHLESDRVGNREEKFDKRTSKSLLFEYRVLTRGSYLKLRGERESSMAIYKIM